jgi:hypothetical protein
MGYTPNMIIGLGFSKATVYKYFRIWKFLDSQVKELIKTKAAKG